MIITREKLSFLKENEGSDKYESDESTAVITRRRRSGLNYLSWVTDHNSEGKTTMDIIVDWLKINKNYTKVMEDLAFDNKAAAMRNYDGIVKKLVETEHVSRKPEAVRQHCIELQNKFYSVLDEFDGQGYAFTEKKDNEVRVLDKNNRKKRLSDLVKKKCKYFYDLRPVNLEWEAASPDASNYYLERRKIRSENQIVNGHSSRSGSSNKRLREDTNANKDEEKGAVTQKDNAAPKIPRVIAETDYEDDDELSSAQSSRANSPHSRTPGLKKGFSNESFDSENTQSSSSNTASTVINRAESKDGVDEENNIYPQINKNTTQHQVTTTSHQVDFQKNHFDIEKHKQSKNRSTESTHQKHHSERRHTTSNMEQNTHKDAPQTKRRKKKKGDDVKTTLKLATRRMALEERKVTLAEREMALEEKKLALQERIIEDQMSKKRFRLLDWLF